jgi:hypothetical protein
MADIDTRLLDARQQQRLSRVPLRVLECRGGPKGHDWPIIHLGKAGKLPKGVKFRRNEEGTCYEEQVCGNGCGRTRWRYTGPGWVFLRGERWSYEGGVEGFSEEPGLGLTRLDYTEKFYEVLAAEREDAAKLENLPADVAEPRAAGIARARAGGGAGPVKFRSAG